MTVGPRMMPPMTSAMTFGCLIKLNAQPRPWVKLMMTKSWMRKRVIG